jgi:hypothetical protein
MKEVLVIPHPQRLQLHRGGIVGLGKLRAHVDLS